MTKNILEIRKQSSGESLASLDPEKLETRFKVRTLFF